VTVKKLTDIFGNLFGRGEQTISIAEPLTLIRRTLAEICRDFGLQEEAKVHLDGEATPEQFIERLVRAKLYADATRFLAYGLPKREAVWWACLCVRSVPACCGDEIATEAMRAAEAWVKEPTEGNCQAALMAGSKHNFEMPGAPAAWTAMAAGWSGGAGETNDKNVFAPPEHLTAHAASGAIILAATVEPQQAKEMYRKFLEMGVQIAQGKMQISP
jgi:hypothetical protein